ncbi:MAG TPA: hypothetical protein VL049_17020 [Candidatus Dormibacteraeota bacterium]|nr:hypothetical protein [Candidatus Dormibacteraeota bacterium]
MLTWVLFAALAAACFWSSRTLSLEWSDEGHIVYPAWRVSQGAFPYLDFRQLYGPSGFFLNGLLFRWFGSDLAVIRASLVVVKLGVALLVLALAQTVASRPIAYLAAGFTVVLWATPWWIFNAPYPNHYALLLTLAGLYGFLRLERRSALACLWAGLCYGLAATFKQTSGVFAFAALAVFLVSDGGEAADVDPLEGSRFDRLVRLACWGVLLAIGGVVAAYLVPRNSPWNVVVLGAPVAVAIALAAASARQLSAPARRRGLVGLAWAGAGLALPPFVYAAYYLGHGLLTALVSNTLTELPRRAQWFDPVPWPAAGAVVLALGIALLLLAVRRRAVLALPAAGCAVAVVLRGLAVQGAEAYWGRGGWQADAIGVLYVLPFAAVWPSLWAGRAAPRPVRVLAAYGAFSLLLLYPAGDRWHLLMGLPAFMPLAAYWMDRLVTAPATDRRTIAPVPLAALVAVALLLVSPYVAAQRFARLVAAGAPPGFTRASGIVGAPPKFGDASALVRFLAQQPPGALLVTCNEQMLYFLAGRPSVLERDEFVFYMVGGGYVDRDAARALAPPLAMVASLEASRSLVVDCPGSAESQRFDATFDEVAQFVDAHYRPLRMIGGYRVRAWDGEPG